MGAPQLPPLVTPLVAMLAGQAAHFQTARPALEALLGPVELESPLWPFEKTQYYDTSMGAPLLRQFFTFESLADAGKLVDWKLACNALELQLAATMAPSGTPPRPINLDPGYLMGSKLVLASTKNFAHRLYLRDGIYAEITLQYRADQWVSHSLTFPDFKSGLYDAFLTKARCTHLRKIRNAPEGA